ncbi:MAG: aromatic ring-hydroxylating dioxygenase subunit alpha [Acidobacteriota bacterium]|nr:aromatic ring-hydroxylating dioxygenase subunit alpha [Acidobacteriota bacterium]
MIKLPKAAYTSPEWHQAEMEHLFSRTWQFAGFVEDIQAPGDYITAQAGLNNLLVTMGRDQRLRAFHNMCRHRGTQLLRTTGKACKAITCPYHDWTYNLNGELISVPEQAEFPGLDKGRLGLHPALVETWLGMIWVHPDPEAESLMHWLGDIRDKVGPHRPLEMVEYPEAATRHEIKANWKIVVENYIDGYHLAHLHAATLNMYDHLKQVTGFRGPHFYFYEPLEKEYARNLKKRAPGPLVDHFTAEKPLGAYVPMLFPNLGITASETSWSIFHIKPEAPDRCVVHTRTRVMPASNWEYYKAEMRAWSYWSKSSGKYGDGEENDPMNSGDFMAEDIYACEQQQKSLTSPMFSVGATAANLESSVVGFQEIVAEFMKNRGVAI